MLQVPYHAVFDKEVCNASYLKETYCERFNDAFIGLKVEKIIATEDLVELGAQT